MISNDLIKIIQDKFFPKAKRVRFHVYPINEPTYITWGNTVIGYMEKRVAYIKTAMGLNPWKNIEKYTK